MTACKATQRTLCNNSDCKVCFDKSFASHPRASCWSEKNIKQPRDVFKSCGQKYKFNCDKCVHDFDNTLDHISRGRWCPYCVNKKLCNNTNCEVCFDRSFASHPRASCWSENNIEEPRNVFKSSGQKYKFNCDKCPHEFESVLNSISKGIWCPYCANKNLCDNTECKVCFEKSFASYKDKHKVLCWSEKNKEKPRDVFISCGQKYKFKCDICPHEFDSVLSSISNGCWCPYCTNKKLCDNTNCEVCFDKSFASYPRASCWSENNKEKPRNVFKSSGQKYKFNCDKCAHEFDSTLAHISFEIWCPYCANKNLCDNTECKVCFEKSFASYPKASCWSEKNIKQPRVVFKSTPDKYKFNCDNCPHDFDSSLRDISNGCWCPYCSNPPKRLCDDCECSKCFEKSFASHNRALYWSEKNKEKPRDVFISCGQKYKFKCDICPHEFDSVLSSISKGRWCPYCVNKTEMKLYQWIIEIVPDIERERTFEWCINTNTCKNYRYDFFSQDLRIIIELDGKQHFTQVSNWMCPIKTQQRDIFKMKKANENGYSIIRLLQEDVFNDLYDWKNELLNVIQNHSNDTITNTYLCKNEEYQCHKELFDNIDIVEIEKLDDDDEDD